MDVTNNLGPDIKDAMATLKAAIPADIITAHYAFADLESKLQANVSADIDKLTAAGQTLLGAPSVAALVQRTIAALITGRTLEIWPPGTPFVIKLGDEPKLPG